MALGVIQVCKEMGIDLSQVPVLGVDATADVLIGAVELSGNFCG